MLVVSRAVLVISQTRSAHDEIEKALSRIESGDTRSAEKGGGMGGFGGGFFSLRLPEGRPSKAPSER